MVIFFFFLNSFLTSVNNVLMFLINITMLLRISLIKIAVFILLSYTIIINSSHFVFLQALFDGVTGLGMSQLKKTKRMFSYLFSVVKCGRSKMLQKR